MFQRQRASTSLMPVADRQAAPSPLTAGINPIRVSARPGPLPSTPRPREYVPAKTGRATSRRPPHAIPGTNPHSMPNPGAPGIRPGAPQESTLNHPVYPSPIKGDSAQRESRRKRRPAGVGINRDTGTDSRRPTALNRRAGNQSRLRRRRQQQPSPAGAGCGRSRDRHQRTGISITRNRGNQPHSNGNPCLAKRRINE